MSCKRTLAGAAAPKRCRRACGPGMATLQPPQIPG
eukprot:CAMPEP_0171276344 /NCGR_PEP_ID=MMETSP0790-20130122/63790_1 /TAXON_ID=2925 /ORGANISM="Alexandrium catenella, Strain OF101" /LENGTH=34 /DNA_ID= /DNA_START= /DNA_END= /DNA_ORIENTATION=